MAAPAWVGAGTTLVDGSTNWSTSLDFTTAHLPSGIRNGDRLIITVLAHWTSGVSSTPSNGTLSDFGTDLGTRLERSTFTTGPTRYDLWVWSFRYGVDITFPITVTPRSSGAAYTPLNTASRMWRGQIFAWRPSHAPGATDHDESGNTVATLPNGAPTVTTTDADALVLAIAALPGHYDTFASVSLGSFTARHTEAATGAVNRGGELRVADRAVSGTSGSPTWTKSGSSPYPDGVSALVALDDPDPPMADSGWSVGFVKF